MGSGSLPDALGLPSPPPSSAAASRRMSMVRTTGTMPERQLRTLLHAKGLRYRLGYRPLPTARYQPDITFPGPKVAIFVDGCFWHGCRDHRGTPKANAEWWQAKIERNRRRDETVNEAFAAEGWQVVRIWEHQPLSDAADVVERVVLARRANNHVGHR